VLAVSGEHCAIFSLRAKRITDIGFAFKPPNRAASPDETNRHTQHVAWPNRAPKSRFFNRHEIDHAIV
jgi:hypothetical protein